MTVRIPHIFHKVFNLLQAKANTIFHISAREINRDAITCLLNLLQADPSAIAGESDYLIANLLSKDQVKFVIEKEGMLQFTQRYYCMMHCKFFLNLCVARQTKISSAEAIGNILLPQINMDLKTQILMRTEMKLLTPQYVSLAPSISFE